MEEVLKKLAISYASNCLRGECISFCKYFKAEGIELFIEEHDDHNDIVLSDKGELSQLGSIYFEDVAVAMRYPSIYLGEALNAIKEKYDLQDPNITIIPDEEAK